jgi:HEAT repeat protein
MIRFSCPNCKTVFEAPDQNAGGQLACPKCGTHLKVPLPPPLKTVLGTLLPEKPGPRRDTDLMTAPQPGTSAKAAAPRARPAPSVRTGVPRSAVVCPSCGLRIKVKGRLTEKTAFCPSCGADLRGPVSQGDSLPGLEEPERPARSWAAIVFAVLALGMGVAAMPAALAYHEYLGPTLAGMGLFLAIVGMFTAVLRGRGAGFGLSLAGTAVCLSVLVVAVMLFGRGILRDAHQARAENTKQADDDTGRVEKGRPAKPPGDRGNAEDGEAEPDPGKGNRPAKPDPRTDPLGDANLTRLVRELRSERRDERIRAAEELGKLKDKARPAARALCEAALDAEESVRQAALEALEKVHPSLYKHVSTFLLDGNPQNRAEAAKSIRFMGKEGNAAAPLFLVQIKKDCYPRRYLNEAARTRPFIEFVSEDVVLVDLATLRAIAPDESSTLSIIVELATYEGENGEGSQVRAAAATAIGELANRRPEQRPEMIRALLAAAQFHSPRGNMMDSKTSTAALNALAKIGPEAKDAIPVLKKLKLSQDMAIREAAAAALEKITGETVRAYPDNPICR